METLWHQRLEKIQLQRVKKIQQWQMERLRLYQMEQPSWRQNWVERDVNQKFLHVWCQSCSCRNHHLLLLHYWTWQPVGGPELQNFNFLPFNWPAASSSSQFFFLLMISFTSSRDMAALFFHWFTAVSILISWKFSLKRHSLPMTITTLRYLLEVGERKIGGSGWREWAGVSSLPGCTFTLFHERSWKK